MNKFDLTLKISFTDKYLVEAETETEARSRVEAMFINQDINPNALRWLPISLGVALEEHTVHCQVVGCESVNNDTDITIGVVELEKLERLVKACRAGLTAEGEAELERVRRELKPLGEDTNFASLVKELVKS